MALAFKVVPHPRQWPGEKTPRVKQRRSNFKTKWTRTMQMLEREIRHLGGRDITIAVDVPGHMIRADGMLRADARPGDQGVIVAFRNGQGERFEFPADRFAWWQDNLYAIASAMEALRKVDRYGVRSGRQYEGFKALPSSTSEHTMTADEAGEIIAQHSGFMVETLLLDPRVFEVAVKAARAKTHPDAGGAPGDFELIDRARAVVERECFGISAEGGG